MRNPLRCDRRAAGVVTLAAVSAAWPPADLPAATDAPPGPESPGTEVEPMPSDAAAVPLIAPGLLDTAAGAVGYRDLQARAADRGVAFVLGYTAVGQWADDTVSGAEALLTGSYDFAGTWDLLDDDRLGHGRFGWLIEGGHVIGNDHGEDLTLNTGTTLGLNDDFDTADIAVTELWWQHVLGEGVATITVGKIDQTVFFDQSAVANDETAQFLATPLVNNPAIPFPDNGLGVNLRVEPAASWYLTAGFGDALASATETGFATIDEGELFWAAEAGYRHDPGGDREGNFRVTVYGLAGTADDGVGFAASLDQHLGGGLIPFFRVGYSADDIADIELFVSGGLGVDAPFGRRGDFAGVAYARADPRGGDTDEESVLEAFYRVRLTETLTVSPDLQLVFDPLDNPDKDVLVVGAVRLQFTF